MLSFLYKDVVASLFLFLFGYTALSKLLNLEQFQRTLERSSLIGAWSPFLSWGVPAVELVLCGLLFLPATRKLAMILTFLLLSGFTLYIGYMLYDASELPCACGGVISALDWTEHLWLNIFLLLVAGIGIRLHRPKILLQ